MTDEILSEAPEYTKGPYTTRLGSVFGADPTCDTDYMATVSWTDTQPGDSHRARQDANAERIVLCLNMHEPLVEALRDMVKLTNALFDKVNWGSSFLDGPTLKMLNENPLRAARLLQQLPAAAPQASLSNDGIAAAQERDGIPDYGESRLCECGEPTCMGTCYAAVEWQAGGAS